MILRLFTGRPLIRSFVQVVVPPLVAAAIMVAAAGCSGLSTPTPPPPPVTSAPGHPQVTRASWYGPGFVGHPTSTGEPYDPNGLTAASRTLPLGSRVRVTNLRNGRSVIVRINDRGPYVRGRGLDLSERAAQQLGLARQGVGTVRISRVDEPAGIPDTSWSGRVRVRRLHRSTTHRRYASARRSRTVANPVGDWLLEMVSPLSSR